MNDQTGVAFLKPVRVAHGQVRSLTSSSVWAEAQTCSTVMASSSTRNSTPREKLLWNGKRSCPGVRHKFRCRTERLSLPGDPRVVLMPGPSEIFPNGCQ